MKPCNQCGKCCIRYGGNDLSASERDLESWAYYRPDIYAYVKDNRLWYDPVSGEALARCPWLQESQSEQQQGQVKYSCSIYADRPEDCRFYPTLIDEMISDECEMLEVVDLRSPRRAQPALDTLMADSRPPVK